MKEYRWGVTLEGRTVEVKAADKFDATKKAAGLLGVRWSKCARDMTVVKLGEARR